MGRAFIERATPLGTCVLLVVGLAAAGCDTVPLTAPTSSTVTVTASATVLPAGGSTDVSAFVAEPSGNAVQNGTMVRFTTNLGRLAPVEVETRNGIAVTTFQAGEDSGIAQVRATSGSSGGATGTTGNMVEITIGAAAVTAVTLRANPGSVPSGGGTVELIASVSGAGGRTLSNVPVTFTTTEGQLAAIRVLSDAAGEARTQLTTNRTAAVTATAGTITSSSVSVVRQDPPSTVSVALAGVADTPTSVGQRFTFTTTVTVTPADASLAPVKFDWDFGDGISASTNGNVTAHVYTVELQRRVVTVRVTLANGQTLSATTEVLVGDFP